MLQARKGNKVYTIDERETDGYAAQGYDIYEGDKLVKHAIGKTVPIDEYEKDKAELEALKAAKPAAKKTPKKVED